MNKKQIDMIFKVLLDTSDDENPFKYTIARVNKCGRYNLRGAEKEDIEHIRYRWILDTYNIYK